MMKNKRNIKPKPVSLWFLVFACVFTFAFLMVDHYLSISKGNTVGVSFVSVIIYISAMQLAFQFRYIDPLVREIERLNKEIKKIQKGTAS